jgi:hypothetical protein
MLADFSAVERLKIHKKIAAVASDDLTGYGLYLFATNHLARDRVERTNPHERHLACPDIWRGVRTCAKASSERRIRERVGI